jgi:hypothetical protein
MCYISKNINSKRFADSVNCRYSRSPEIVNASGPQLSSACSLSLTALRHPPRQEPQQQGGKHVGFSLADPITIKGNLWVPVALVQRTTVTLSLANLMPVRIHITQQFRQHCMCDVHIHDVGRRGFPVKHINIDPVSVLKFNIQ